MSLRVEELKHEATVAALSNQPKRAILATCWTTNSLRRTE